MCLWLLTACLGMLTVNPSTNIVVVQTSSGNGSGDSGSGAGMPTPIVMPTTTTTTTTTKSGTTIAPPATSVTPPATTAAPSTTTQISSTAARPPPMTTTAQPVTNSAPPPSGAPPIDPRLGTTTAASAAYQVPPIMGYTAQIPLSDSAVRFPRERRGIENADLKSIKDFIMNIGSDDSGHEIRKRQNQPCTCVAAGTCTLGTPSGAGYIDLRIVNPGGGGGSAQCPFGQVLCCTGAMQPQQVVACGTQQQVPAVVVTPDVGQAKYGEFPWQALILTKQNDYISGGVLIDQRNVLTVTHRIAPFIVSGTAPNVKVRLGEWDASAPNEPVPYQEYLVSRAVSHPSYNALTLQYDVTVLRLTSSVPLTPMPGAAPTINRACLPPSSASSYVGQRCWVSGWGKDMFGMRGQFQQILRKVDVPIVAPVTCQTQLQAARLGASYILDTTSFICAGGESNKDACTGDGGSGLVCNVNGQWVVVGLVSWGLGCANPNVPAAYVNVAALLPWIQQQVASS